MLGEERADDAGRRKAVRRADHPDLLEAVAGRESCGSLLFGSITTPRKYLAGLVGSVAAVPVYVDHVHAVVHVVE